MPAHALWSAEPRSMAGFLPLHFQSRCRKEPLTTGWTEQHSHMHKVGLSDCCCVGRPRGASAHTKLPSAQHVCAAAHGCTSCDGVQQKDAAAAGTLQPLCKDVLSFTCAGHVPYTSDFCATHRLPRNRRVCQRVPAQIAQHGAACYALPA